MVFFILVCPCITGSGPGGPSCCPSPFHPDPLPFRLRPCLLPTPSPNSSLSFPKLKEAPYPDTRSPVELGARDSASFDRVVSTLQLSGFRNPGYSQSLLPWHPCGQRRNRRQRGRHVNSIRLATRNPPHKFRKQSLGGFLFCFVF